MARIGDTARTSLKSILEALLLASDEPLDLTDIRNSLTSLMWRNCGVRRNREELVQAAETIDAWQKYVLPRQFDRPTGWELQNMLIVARIMIESAVSREESRGVHFRSDFPEMDNEQWRRHLSYKMQGR